MLLKDSNYDTSWKDGPFMEDHCNIDTHAVMSQPRPDYNPWLVGPNANPHHRWWADEVVGGALCVRAVRVGGWMDGEIGGAFH